MEVRDIMNSDVLCCAADDDLQTAAELMQDEDVGALPVIESPQSRTIVGIITDRDIACRAVAEGKGPHTTVRECMTTPVLAIPEDAYADECLDLMSERQVRRLLVVDDQDRLVGIVSQADIARQVGDSQVGKLVRELSRPNSSGGLFVPS